MNPSEKWNQTLKSLLLKSLEIKEFKTGAIDAGSKDGVSHRGSDCKQCIGSGIHRQNMRSSRATGEIQSEKVSRYNRSCRSRFTLPGRSFLGGPTCCIFDRKFLSWSEHKDNLPFCTVCHNGTICICVDS